MTTFESNRRNFLKQSLALSALSATPALALGGVKREPGTRLRLASSASTRCWAQNWITSKRVIDPSRNGLSNE